MDVNAEILQQRLRDLAPSSPPKGERHAAVAVLLRFEPEPKVLLMRRAERPGDRWSGQVGLPGGHREDDDADLWATATRETHEELGLHLERIARPLGRLPHMQARARSKRLALYVAPFVFEELEPAQPSLGPEAARAFWLPLAAAQSGELDRPYAYRGEDVDEILHFPSWAWDGESVWGMTHHILGGLLDLLYPDSHRPPRSSGPLPPTSQAD